MLIGLTGGIACGKSTVAAALVDRGARLVDADRIARDLVAPGAEALAAVIEAFGPAMLDRDGRLDRARLGALVFNDADARDRLDTLMRPRIEAESRRRIAAALADAPPMVIYDAALIVEWGLAAAFRPLVVVTVPHAVQLERLMARDGSAAAAARARIDAQMPLAEKVAVADHVIDNGGPRAATERQVEGLWRTLVG